MLEKFTDTWGHPLFQAVLNVAFGVMWIAIGDATPAGGTHHLFEAVAAIMFWCSGMSTARYIMEKL
jgi:hypothetical protein